MQSLIHGRHKWYNTHQKWFQHPSAPSKTRKNCAAFSLPRENVLESHFVFLVFFLQFFRAPLLERQAATLFWNLNSMIFQAIPGGFFQNKFQFDKGILRRRLEMTVLFQLLNFRSNHQRCLKSFLNNFGNFTGKHLCQSLFLMTLKG